MILSCQKIHIIHMTVNISISWLDILGVKLPCAPILKGLFVLPAQVWLFPLPLFFSGHRGSAEFHNVFLAINMHDGQWLCLHHNRYFINVYQRYLSIFGVSMFGRQEAPWWLCACHTLSRTCFWARASNYCKIHDDKGSSLKYDIGISLLLRITEMKIGILYEYIDATCSELV